MQLVCSKIDVLIDFDSERDISVTASESAPYVPCPRRLSSRDCGLGPFILPYNLKSIEALETLKRVGTGRQLSP